MADSKYDLDDVRCKHSRPIKPHTCGHLHAKCLALNGAAFYSVQEACIRQQLAQESGTRTQETGRSHLVHISCTICLSVHPIMLKVNETKSR